MITKFRRISRVTKKYTDKLKNRPCSDVQGRFEVAFLSYFYEKSDKNLYREILVWITYNQ